MVKTFSFSTGPSTLPDIGMCSYNGCTFSPLVFSTVSGTAVKDVAGRTVKLMEYRIEVDGYVTAAITASDTPPFPDVRGFGIAPAMNPIVFARRPNNPRLGRGINWWRCCKRG